MNLPHITAKDFDEIVNEDKESCLVVFAKESCSVCKQLSPTIEKIAQSYEGDNTLNFYTIDVQDPEGLALFKSLKLIGVPQTVFFLNGEQKEALPGALSESIIRKEINDMINPKQGFMGKLKGLFGK